MKSLLSRTTPVILAAAISAFSSFNPSPLSAQKALFRVQPIVENKPFVGEPMLVFQMHQTKKNNQQPLDDAHATYGEKHISTYIDDSFYSIFKPSSQDNTTYHLRGWNGYDAGSSYRQVVSSPQIFGIEVELPKPLNQLQSGDQILIAGKTYSITSQSGLSLQLKDSKGTALVLQDGARVNFVSSGDADYNWKVHIGGSNIPEMTNSNPDATSTHLWIYNEDTFTGTKYTSGNSLPFPTFLSGKITYDGLVHNQTVPISVSGLSSTDFPIGDSQDNRRDIYHVKSIQLKTTDGQMIENLDPSGRPIPVNTVYFLPAKGSIIYKPVGANNYQEVTPANLNIITEASGLGDRLSVIWDKTNNQFTFLEAGRPYTGGSIDNNVESFLPYTEYSKNVDVDTYRFKPTDSTLSVIRYTRLPPGPTSSFELPLVTSRGSKWTSISTTDAQFQYSREIAQAQWSLDVAGATSSVRNMGAISPATMQIQNYPNPFTAQQGTRVSFTLPQDSHIRVKLYNIMGGEVATLADERHAAGKVELGFKPEGNLAAGTYICRLEVDGQMTNAKTVNLVK